MTNQFVADVKAASLAVLCTDSSSDLATVANANQGCRTRGRLHSFESCFPIGGQRVAYWDGLGCFAEEGATLPDAGGVA